jgi:hypothetical protein
MQIAKEHGLFVALVAYVLWDGRQREQRLLRVIDTLSDDVKVRISKIEANISHLFSYLFGKKKEDENHGR